MDREKQKELLKLLRAAYNALRSYQYGNKSTELAEEVADEIEEAIDMENKYWREEIENDYRR